jgi:hypothetical protein
MITDVEYKVFHLAVNSEKSSEYQNRSQRRLPMLDRQLPVRENAFSAGYGPVNNATKTMDLRLDNWKRMV